MKISLCMICGNEEAIIIRCLESAKGAFDELCLVRAIGENKHDQTFVLVDDWCRANGKECTLEEYYNTIQGLPHVDDFAAARNQSFSLATCDWQLWLDCDDLLTPEACSEIRECATENKADGYAFMYAKAGGGNCPRERLIKRGKGRWKNRIHETCQLIGGGELCMDNDITVTHAPIGEKKSSHDRNKRLLLIALDDAPRHYFYLHEEFYNAKDIQNAIRTGKAALELLNTPEERYEIFLNLAELEPDKAHEWLFKAVQFQPWRREALAYLTQNALANSDRSSAISYFRMMDALPRPDPLPWTHRELWHGWARNYLRVKILRLSGEAEQADKDHAEYMKNPAYADGVSKHGSEQ